MKELIIDIESVTPSLAKTYLSTNTKNRSVRLRKVASFAAMMASGQWLLTHQGIAFDMDGVLLDGQHRLMAVMESGKTVRMAVFRNVPDTKDIKAMAVIDTGTIRSNPDQLRVCYNIKNSATVSAACTTIAQVLVPQSARVGLTPVQTKAIADIYGDRITEVLHVFANSFKPAVKASVIGAVALAVKVSRNSGMDFVHALATGENLKPGSPAMTLRNWLINKRFNGNSDGAKERRALFAGVTLNAIYAFKNGQELVSLRPSDEATDHFVKASRNEVATIRALLNLDGRK